MCGTGNICQSGLLWRSGDIESKDLNILYYMIFFNSFCIHLNLQTKDIWKMPKQMHRLVCINPLLQKHYTPQVRFCITHSLEHHKRHPTSPTRWSISPQWVHTSLSTDNQGIQWTKRLVEKKFWWPSMLSDVKKFVKDHYTSLIHHDLT